MSSEILFAGRRFLLTAVVLLLLLMTGARAQAQSVDEAYRFYRNEQWGEAAELLSLRVDRGRAQPGEIALLGMCYINMDELEKAEEAIEGAYMLDPENYAVLLARGNLALGKEEFDAAERRFLEAAALRPRRTEAMQGAAMAAFAAGVRLLQEGRYEEAVPKLRRAAEKLRDVGGRDEERVLPALITALRHTGRREELLTAYRRFLELSPKSADARAGLGLLLYERGEISRALEELRQAVDLDTADPEPYLILARRALGGGEKDEGRKLLQETISKAVRLYSMYRVQAARTMENARGEAEFENRVTSAGNAPADDDSSGRVSYGSSKSSKPDQGMQEGKIRSLKQLAESAERPRGILQEALELLQSAYVDGNSLRKDLRRLVRWYPSSAEVRAALAEELDAAGLHGEARQQWRELIERAAFYHKAHLGLGYSYEREGAGRMALRSYRRALDLAPGDREVYRRLRNYYRSRGGPEAYLRLLEEQLLKEGYNTVLLEETAAAAEDTGDPETAARYRSRAEEIREYRARAAAEDSAE